VAAHHDWWAPTYDQDYSRKMAVYHAVTLDNILRFLPADRTLPVLDAGGGTGIWSIELARRGYRLVLTDISEGMLEQARARVREQNVTDLVSVRYGDIRSMPEFPDGSFAVVLCQGDPLSYCGDHQAAVRELARVVRPGGTVLSSVDARLPALRWLPDKEDLSAVGRLLETGDIVMPTQNPDFGYQIHAFTPAELSAAFAAAGLEPLRIIGKTVIAHLLPGYRSDDPAVRQQLVEMELRHNEDPALLPAASHLEIAARKPLSQQPPGRVAAFRRSR
jgi:SAM-dependent methyltransferase